MLKKLSELDTAQRNAPCQEYPGEWLVYVNGEHFGTFTTFMLAKQAACEASFRHAEVEMKPGVTEKISVCWAANSNDPRIGEVWFTSFYEKGFYDSYGQWRET